MRPPKLIRRHPLILLKKTIKVRIILKIQLICNLGRRHPRIGQQTLRLEQHSIADHLPGRTPQQVLTNGIQMIRRHEKQLRIFTGAAKGLIMLLDELLPIGDQLLFLRDSDRIGGLRRFYTGLHGEE